MAETLLNGDAKAVTSESHGKVTETVLQRLSIEIKGQNPEHQKTLSECSFEK